MTTKNIMNIYITRDYDGTLCIFNNKPIKDIEQGIWYDGLNFSILNDQNNNFSEFKDVKWTDDEPKQIEIKLL